MKARSLGALFAVVVLVVASAGDTPPAEACGSSSIIVMATQLHPDLPLDAFAKGHLGLLKPSFARSYLVVAFRWLDGIGLDDNERSGALALWEDRLGRGGEAVVRARTSPGPAPAPTTPLTRWAAARAAAIGSPTPPPPIVPSVVKSFATVDNCLDDAFDTASATAADRARRFGAGSAEILDWVRAQDDVFATCGGTSTKPPGATAFAALRADRDYQIASAHFYAMDFAEAERRFGLIASDAASPWQPFGRYLAARSITRGAMLAGPTPDLKELARAEVALSGIAHDARLARVHGPARRYLSFVRARTAKAPLARELGVRLARERVGEDMHQALGDYTTLIDLGATPPSVPESDRLATFLAVVQGTNTATFERALALHAKSGSLVWLVAALMRATNATDPRLDPLLARAESIAPSSPAFATARFHRARVLLARGASPRAFEDLRRTLAGLRREDGASTRNELTALAMRAAPTLDAFLSHAFVRPAGTESVDSPIVPLGEKEPSAGEGFFPEAVEVLSARVPIASYVLAARSTALPRGLRATIAAAAFVRAELLGDAHAAARVAQAAMDANVDARPFMARILAAPDDAARRLGLVHMLLKFPSLGPTPRAWRSGPAAPATVDSSYGDFGWCALAAAPAAAPSPSFLSRAERVAADDQARKLAALGAASTFLANEAARLADRMPGDPRVPEALHLAVRLTRYGCKDAGTTAASRAAFRALHAKFAQSGWTKQTPYHY